MLIDLTLRVTPALAADARGREKKALTGHLGTHFDVMDREFPLDYVRRQGVFFDVSALRGREIEPEDVDLSLLEPGTFAAFYTGFLDEAGYGTAAYFKQHPQLSQALISALLERCVSLIGVDCAGIRRGPEHTPADQRCADRGTFVVENLCRLDRVLEGDPTARCVVHTYPMNFSGMTGLPCRVVAER